MIRIMTVCGFIKFEGIDVNFYVEYKASQSVGI